MIRNECNEKSSKMKLDCLKDIIDDLFEYMKTDAKGMENLVYHFIDDLYESLDRMSEYSDFRNNLFYIILELMRREISSELGYSKFESDGNSISNSYFEEMFVRYKIEHLVIELIDILSDGKYGYLRCYHSNLPVEYLLSVDFDDKELSEELSEDVNVKELMDGVIEIKVCEECHRYFNFFIFDLSKWMHLKHLGWMKITPLTFNSTEI